MCDSCVKWILISISLSVFVCMVTVFYQAVAYRFERSWYKKRIRALEAELKELRGPSWNPDSDSDQESVY